MLMEIPLAGSMYGPCTVTRRGLIAVPVRCSSELAVVLRRLLPIKSEVRFVRVVVNRTSKARSKSSIEISRG